ncbi:MAG: TonB-dependent copper receptor [Gammaproteobacteria bacterium]
MHRKKSLSLAILATLSQASLAAEQSQVARTLEEMVVTGVRMDSPLNIVTDPKTPRQPLPAHDGADYLKTIPGFSVIRKGGGGGDPVLRGMAGSRLSLLMDGEMILGGCGNRMDPPTAYIFPESYDTIRVIKGPQSVQYGPGNSAGIVLFDRDTSRPEESGWEVHSSAVGGSYGRNDQILDATMSTPTFTLRGTGTHSAQNDYEDGDGTSIHSEYERWSTQLSLAWTPDDTTYLEMGAARSDGETAYADRGMDGTVFDRENYSIKFEKKNLTTLIESLEMNAFYNYVDHVMDNYTLREPSAMMPNPMASNPDRKTTGARLAMTLRPAPEYEVVLGIDTQANKHSVRSTMNQTMMPYENMARNPDAEFQQVGLFGELSWDLSMNNRIIAGLRTDRWQAEDTRENVQLNMMMSMPNPTFGKEREETLQSGFLRYEKTLLAGSTTFFAGLGHSERFPDYWEMIGKESADSTSAFYIDPEKTTQLDVGFMYQYGGWDGSVSLFANEIKDYLMIESGYLKPAMGGTRSASIVRNIDARTWGLELDGQYHFNDYWRTEITLASVRGANDTDGRTLPQLPPLEGRVGLYYDNSNWSAGMMWRSISAQDRFDINRGNIVGQDFGPTGSANILSMNGGWRYSDSLSFTAGVDNVLDETYAEHISRAGAAIAGFDQTTRVNEPGRILWVRAQLTF